MTGFDDRGEHVQCQRLVVQPATALNVTPLRLAGLARMFLNSGDKGSSPPTPSIAQRCQGRLAIHLWAGGGITDRASPAKM